MMRSRMLLTAALVFVLVSAVAAQAATLRTAPFPSDLLASGSARCAVTNAGNTTGTFTSATLYQNDGVLLRTLGSAALDAHHTLETATFLIANGNPTHCECVVPSAATWRCAFQFVDGSTITVIGAP
jgi:hypothetical protein